jgi:hypothetical protein
MSSTVSMNIAVLSARSTSGTGHGNPLEHDPKWVL